MFSGTPLSRHSVCLPAGLLGARHDGWSSEVGESGGASAGVHSTALADVGRSRVIGVELGGSAGQLQSACVTAGYASEAKRLGDYVFGLRVHPVGGEQNGESFCCFIIL